MEELLDKLLIPALLVLVTSGVTSFFSRRIQNADVATKFQALASKQADDNAKLEAEIDKLKLSLCVKDNEIASLKDENASLKLRVAELENEIEALQRRRK